MLFTSICSTLFFRHAQGSRGTDEGGGIVKVKVSDTEQGKYVGNYQVGEVNEEE